MSAIIAGPLVVDNLSADISALFELLDDDRKEQLLEHWQRLLEEQRAAQAASA
jgi:Mor family transcriptional regulator